MGPDLLKEQRYASASHIVRISGLLHVLLDEGCANATTYPVKFESAVKQKLELDPTCTEKRIGIDIYCHEVTTHVRFVFGTLRIIKKRTSATIAVAVATPRPVESGEGPATANGASSGIF